MTSPHLCIALSGHGYGHLAQCIPVVNALRDALPALRVTVCSGLPEAVIATRLQGSFDYVAATLDPVLPMFNAWEVDIEKAGGVYRDFHADYATGLQADRDLLASVSPGLLLANAPYRVIEAASCMDIPAIGLCSLNWADVFNHYLSDMPGAAGIHEQMLAGYRAADSFLTPEPCLPMPGLDNTQRIGPVARTGSSCREALLSKLSLQQDTTLVLVALGGIATGLPVACWPRRENTVWLFAESVRTKRDDMVNVAMPGLPLVDVIASVDAVITKPGYGTYTEAVCSGTALLTLQRPDWPETPYLNAWADRHGRHAEITREQFFSGEIVGALEELLSAPSPGGAPAAPGATEAAAFLLDRLA